jgi:hypothetical protein
MPLQVVVPPSSLRPPESDRWVKEPCIARLTGALISSTQRYRLVSAAGFGRKSSNGNDLVTDVGFSCANTAAARVPGLRLIAGVAVWLRSRGEGSAGRIA